MLLQQELDRWQYQDSLYFLRPHCGIDTKRVSASLGVNFGKILLDAGSLGDQVQSNTGVAFLRCDMQRSETVGVT